MDNDKTQLILQTAEDLLAPFGLPAHRPAANRLDFLVQSASLLDIIRPIIDTRWGYLSTITGLDHPGNVSRELGDRQWRQQELDQSDDRERDGSIEIMYHFCSGAAVLTLHVWVSYTNPGVPSVANLIPSAIYEIELSEMFGVHVRNSPSDKEHLLLPEDWPQNVYPLRKSFTGLKETTKN